MVVDKATHRVGKALCTVLYTFFFFLQTVFVQLCSLLFSAALVQGFPVLNGASSVLVSLPAPS